jgi:hypothetical protein
MLGDDNACALFVVVGQPNSQSRCCHCRWLFLATACNWYNFDINLLPFVEKVHGRTCVVLGFEGDSSVVWRRYTLFLLFKSLPLL